jgi:benzylmalonyl-CoA dehydrogenase
MDFDLSPEQREIRATFARFSDERIAPHAAAIDASHAFPREAFEQLAAMGLFGMRYPEEDGGTGLALIEFCLALEEIARGSLSVAACVAMQSLMGTKFLHMLGYP